MARSQKQKLKLLYLMRFLLQQSDEAHPVGIAQMVEELASHDIPAERKSLYDDIEALRAFGLDVVQSRGKTVGYYVGTREFELPELKLLVDSVQSSKFITQRKTISLIRKNESLASVHDAVLLQRQENQQGPSDHHRPRVDGKLCFILNQLRRFTVFLHNDPDLLGLREFRGGLDCLSFCMLCLRVRIFDHHIVVVIDFSVFFVFFYNMAAAHHIRKAGQVRTAHPQPVPDQAGTDQKDDDARYI